MQVFTVEEQVVLSPCILICIIKQCHFFRRGKSRATNCQFSLLLGTITLEGIFTVRYLYMNLPDKHLHWRKRAVRRPPIATYQNSSRGRISFKREVELCPQKHRCTQRASLENSKYSANLLYVWLHQFCRKAAIVWQTALEKRASPLLYSQCPTSSQVLQKDNKEQKEKDLLCKWQSTLPREPASAPTQVS